MAFPTQTADNHAKMVPAYHYVASPLIFFPTIYFIYLAATDFSVERLMMALFGMGLVVGILYARMFPLGVQDRVIRLEERLRMERLLPAHQHGRIHEVSTSQLIGLRFASDEELPELVERILDGGLSDRKEIKHAVKNWRADTQRI